MSRSSPGTVVVDQQKTSVIGRGCLGKVLFPPPRCFDEGLSEARQLELQQYVMKLGTRERALHAVKVAQHIRSNWSSLCAPLKVARLQPIEAGMRQMWRSSGPEGFYALPLDKICNRCGQTRQPDTVRSVQHQSDLVGVYMRHAGRPWPTLFPHVAVRVAGQNFPKLALSGEEVKNKKQLTPRAQRMVGRLILGVLALHRLGVTHNDLHAHNLLVDDQDVPRWCDFENSVLEREEDGDRVVSDSLPLDARIYTALMDSPGHVFLSGTWVRDRPTHVDRDWQWLADLVESTWPPQQNPKSKCRNWSHAIQALRRGTDRDAAFAWSLVLTSKTV